MKQATLFESDATPANTATDLIGLRIRLNRTVDVPCGACGETTVVVGQGAGPHVAGLRCASCDRHRGWLPKPITEFLLATISQFGWPPEAITIRNSEFAQANTAAPSVQSQPKHLHRDPKMQGT